MRIPREPAGRFDPLGGIGEAFCGYAGLAAVPQLVAGTVAVRLLPHEPLDRTAGLADGRGLASGLADGLADGLGRGCEAVESCGGRWLSVLRVAWVLATAEPGPQLDGGGMAEGGFQVAGCGVVAAGGGPAVAHASGRAGT